MFKKIAQVSPRAEQNIFYATELPLLPEEEASDLARKHGHFTRRESRCWASTSPRGDDWLHDDGAEPVIFLEMKREEMARHFRDAGKTVGEAMQQAVTNVGQMFVGLREAFAPTSNTKADFILWPPQNEPVIPPIPLMSIDPPSSPLTGGEDGARVVPPMTARDQTRLAILMKMSHPDLKGMLDGYGLKIDGPPSLKITKRMMATAIIHHENTKG